MKLILMRGVSGSGKSTLARKLLEQHPGAVIYSTDDFFMVDGQYVFDPKKLGQYHAENHRQADLAMAAGCPCVIIDNTNTAAWEMKSYVESAQSHGYAVEIHMPEPVDFEEIMRRQSERADSNKALPAEVVKRMLDRFEHDVTVETIIASKRPF